MKRTSNYHGFQVIIHTLDGEILWNKGKAYKSRKKAQEIL